jgi:hypothetical protein
MAESTAMSELVDNLIGFDTRQCPRRNALGIKYIR